MCFTRSYELHKRFGEFSFLIMESLYIYCLDIINLPDLVYKFCLEVDEGMKKPYILAVIYPLTVDKEITCIKYCCYMY